MTSKWIKKIPCQARNSTSDYTQRVASDPRWAGFPPESDHASGEQVATARARYAGTLTPEERSAIEDWCYAQFKADLAHWRSMPYAEAVERVAKQASYNFGYPMPYGYPIEDVMDAAWSAAERSE